MAIGEYIDKSTDDGACFGRSDGKIGFYGLASPIVKPSFTAAAVSTTGAIAGSNYGFNATQANGIIALVNEIRAKLVAFGLVTT